MTISTAPSPFIDHNQQTFETCITLALQFVASIEIAPEVGDEAPTLDQLLDFARQLDRHADDIARLAGQPLVNIPGQGWAQYQTFRRDGSSHGFLPCLAGNLLIMATGISEDGATWRPPRCRRSPGGPQRRRHSQGLREGIRQDGRRRWPSNGLDCPPRTGPRGKALRPRQPVG